MAKFDLPLDRRHFLSAAAASTVMAPAIARAQTKSLKVAILLPQSGFFAQAGQSCHRGALAAPKVLADLGYKVELVHVDIESNADTARTQTEKAINEGANCIIGAFDSGATLAIAQVCEQRKVPLVINIAAAPQITEQGYKYLVRNFQTGGQLVTNGLRLIKDLSAATKVEFKKAVFLHANDTFGTGQRKAMDRDLPQAEHGIHDRRKHRLRSARPGPFGRSHQDAGDQPRPPDGRDPGWRCD